MGFLGYETKKEKQANIDSLAAVALAEFQKQEAEKWENKAKQSALSFRANQPEATYYGQEYVILEELWDGEKTQGNLGSPVEYVPSYTSLSARSWEAYTSSDMAQAVVKAHLNWVIGSGLKFQAEPIEGVIESEGFNLDVPEFKKTTEERFRLYVKTKDSTYSKMVSYQTYQRTAYFNAIVSGDILCIDAFQKGLPVKRLEDGRHIQQPSPEQIEEAKGRGNTVIHGVEIMPNGEHYAFYVINKDLKYDQILARGKNTGRLQAYLLYGSEYRVDSVRGMPLLSATLEKLKKLDRYNEAIVSGTEEAAKIAYVWEHKIGSEGLNPEIAAAIQTMAGESATEETEVSYTEVNKLIKRTFDKDAINAPPGSTLKKLTGGMEVNQEAFVTGNFIYICAAVEIPYEVVLMKYVNSFSSSRMASQSWQKILEIKRVVFNDVYNKPFYNLFLEAQVLAGKIVANGYLSAIASGDIILIEAYRNCRFTGISVPQADPFKEVKAQKEMLEMNVTNRDLIIESLGNGDDFSTIVDKKAAEDKLIKTLMPEPDPVEPPANK